MEAGWITHMSITEDGAVHTMGEAAWECVCGSHIGYFDRGGFIGLMCVASRRPLEHVVEAWK